MSIGSAYEGDEESSIEVRPGFVFPFDDETSEVIIKDGPTTYRHIEGVQIKDDNANATDTSDEEYADK